MHNLKLSYNLNLMVMTFSLPYMQNIYYEDISRPRYHYLTPKFISNFKQKTFLKVPQGSLAFIVESFDIPLNILSSKILSIQLILYRNNQNDISNNDIIQDTTSHLLFLIKVLFDFLFSSRLTRIELGIKLNSKVMRGEKE